MSNTLHFSFVTLVAFLWIALSFGAASAQTTTTYTYDAQGRMVYAKPNTKEFLDINYDDANNITDLISNDDNAYPICGDINTTVSSSSYTMSGLSQCTEPEGEVMTLISVTDPIGPATATIGANNQIIFQNIGCGLNRTTRRVKDVNGKAISSAVDVTTGPCGPGGGPGGGTLPPF